MRNFFILLLVMMCLMMFLSACGASEPKGNDNDVQIRDEINDTGYLCYSVYIQSSLSEKAILDDIKAELTVLTKETKSNTNFDALNLVDYIFYHKDNKNEYVKVASFSYYKSTLESLKRIDKNVIDYADDTWIHGNIGK